jgi:hypothetical protein
MALPAPLRALMRHECIIEPYAGQDAYGVRVYGSASTETCRVVGQRKIVTDGTGKQVVSSIQVYLARDVVVDVRSRVTLPSGTFTGQSSQPPIISTGYFPDAISNGMSHSVVYL